MKTKLAWIPFVPLFLAAGFLKLAQGFMPDGGLMGLSSLQLDYCYIGACVLIFLFTLLFVLLDKKIAQYYLPHKNFPAGLTGIVLSLLLAADGGFTIFQVFSSGKISVLEILGAVLSLLSAVVFIVLGLKELIFDQRDPRDLLRRQDDPQLCAVHDDLDPLGGCQLPDLLYFRDTVLLQLRGRVVADQDQKRAEILLCFRLARCCGIDPVRDIPSGVPIRFRVDTQKRAAYRDAVARSVYSVCIDRNNHVRS